MKGDKDTHNIPLYVFLCFQLSVLDGVKTEVFVFMRMPWLVVNVLMDFQGNYAK